METQEKKKEKKKQNSQLLSQAIFWKSSSKWMGKKDKDIKKRNQWFSEKPWAELHNKVNGLH